MHKTSLTNTVLARIGSKPALSRNRLLSLLVIGGLAMSGITVGTKIWLGRVGIAHSALTVEHRLTVGEALFHVPENMLRRPQDRHSGPLESIELYLLWPQLSGYSTDQSAAFNHTDGRNQIIFVSIAPKAGPETAMERIQNSYFELTETSEAGPAGLEIRRFQEGGGFMNEVLAVGQRAPEAAFIARCLSDEMAALSLAPCERRLPFTQFLSLTYRFSEELLPDWQVLDEKLLTRLNTMLQK